MLHSKQNKINTAAEITSMQPSQPDFASESFSRAVDSEI